MNEFFKKIKSLFTLIEKALEQDALKAMPKEQVDALKNIQQLLKQTIEILDARRKLPKKDQRDHRKLTNISLDYQKEYNELQLKIEEAPMSKKEIKLMDHLDKRLKKFLKEYISSSIAVQEALDEEKKYLQKLNELILDLKETEIDPLKNLSGQEENPTLTTNATEKANAVYEDVTTRQYNAIVDLFKKGSGF